METEKIELDARQEWIGTIMSHEGWYTAATEEQRDIYWKIWLTSWELAANLYKGASHAQERLYSRQEVIDILREFDSYCINNVEVAIRAKLVGKKEDSVTIDVTGPDGGTWFMQEYNKETKET